MRYTLLLLFAISLITQAQETSKAVGFDNMRTEIVGEQLGISFAIKASELQLGPNGQLKLEFAVENEDKRLALPVVIYSGKQRYRYERRRETLSNTYYLKPYYIYKNVTKRDTYELDYQLFIPYYAWMEHASITYREYLRNCVGDYIASDGVLVENLNPVPVYVEPENDVVVVEDKPVWKPNLALLPQLVNFLTPEVEEVKTRASMLELNIGFPVNVTEIRPTFGNNVYELNRADSLVSMLQSNELININAVNIRGYASPEGSYAVNERLARGRSQAFMQYLVNKYPNNEYIRNANTSWVPEDWEGFGRMVEADNSIAQKQEVLAIINNNNIDPDVKDQMLQKITWWSSNYKIILNEMYPKLRRIEFKVDYTVNNLTDSQAREQLYTNPGMLSLDEIYRVANYYEPDSRQYREVYEIAVRQYPNDVIANNNAAAAAILNSDITSARFYLQKIQDDPRSYVNRGCVCYIEENLDGALEWFIKAAEAGIEAGRANFNLLGGNAK